MIFIIYLKQVQIGEIVANVLNKRILKREKGWCWRVAANSESFWRGCSSILPVSGILLLPSAAYIRKLPLQQIRYFGNQ